MFFWFETLLGTFTHSLQSLVPVRWKKVYSNLLTCFCLCYLTEKLVTSMRYPELLTQVAHWRMTFWGSFLGYMLFTSTQRQKFQICSALNLDSMEEELTQNHSTLADFTILIYTLIIVPLHTVFSAMYQTYQTPTFIDTLNFVFYRFVLTFHLSKAIRFLLSMVKLRRKIYFYLSTSWSPDLRGESSGTGFQHGSASFRKFLGRLSHAEEDLRCWFGPPFDAAVFGVSILTASLLTLTNKITTINLAFSAAYTVLIVIYCEKNKSEKLKVQETLSAQMTLVENTCSRNVYRRAILASIHTSNATISTRFFRPSISLLQEMFDFCLMVAFTLL